MENIYFLEFMKYVLKFASQKVLVYVLETIPFWKPLLYFLVLLRFSSVKNCNM